MVAVEQTIYLFVTDALGALGGFLSHRPTSAASNQTHFGGDHTQNGFDFLTIPNRGTYTDALFSKTQPRELARARIASGEGRVVRILLT